MKRSVVLWVGVLGMAWAPLRVNAHEGDHQVLNSLQRTYGPWGARVPVPDTRATIEEMVEHGSTLLSESHRPLLPAEMTVDSAIWRDQLLQLRLTLPEQHTWQPSPVDLESLGTLLMYPWRGRDDFAGITVEVREGVTGDYRNWSTFMETAPPTGSASEPVDVVDPARMVTHPPRVTNSIGGPTTHGRQPQGPLSGVTVYVSGGHGWTAGTSSWFLQRPLLLGMNEDYGNIDMMNYFVHFLFNAGATVVPFRPVGWQPIEITIDQDDPQVSYSGAWGDSGNTKRYENGVTNSGVAYRFASTNPTETATARYTAAIPTTDFYPVYCFTIASTNRVPQTYRISHSGGISEVVVDHREVGNGWVWLGEYYFEAGGDNYVEISNASPIGGVVVADGIRFGGGIGDVVRPGPGDVSGFPRDEEGQRYFAESELGNNAAGFDSGIWDLVGFNDNSDNVGAAARWAREMNQVPAGGVLVDRWKRIHLEFHTNAAGNARGQLCLITNTGATTNQSSYATILADEIDADLLLLQDEFEHNWVDRALPTLTSGFGAISTGNNSNEFDATIVELAFHDQEDDAELLRDARVRQAMARACTHGIIRFLNTLPGSQVDLLFAPDTPRGLRVEDLGGGDVRLSWEAPLADAARGDPATGYVVYQSSNGYGFGDPIVLGNVTTTTLNGVPTGETRYYRVAATNAGGESMPTEVLAVRRPATGTAALLVVNGFDRLRRQINEIMTFTQPPSVAGQSIERQKWRSSNSYDYIVQYADALAANDVGFMSASNEAVEGGVVALGDFPMVVWVLGTESTEDATFSSTEQTRVDDYLQAGGALFVSGADIGFDLLGNGTGVTFANQTLRINFVADEADTFDVAPAPGGFLADLPPFDFDPDNGAVYEVRNADRIGESTDAQPLLNYVGGAGGVAGVQFSGKVYNAVTFGFPFEAISDAGVRADVMQRVIEFLETATGPLDFDSDSDGDVDFDDVRTWAFCFRGDEFTFPDGTLCLDFDDDDDNDVDLQDMHAMQRAYTGSLPLP